MLTNSTAHVSSRGKFPKTNLLLANNLFSNQEMVCIGKLTNACGDATIGVGEGMLVSEAIQDVFVSTHVF